MVGPTPTGTASATLISRLLELRYSGLCEANFTQGRVTRGLIHRALLDGGDTGAGARQRTGDMPAPRKFLCDLVLLARELKQE